jgi:hypothetical protein
MASLYKQDTLLSLVFFTYAKPAQAFCGILAGGAEEGSPSIFQNLAMSDYFLWMKGFPGDEGQKQAAYDDPVVPFRFFRHISIHVPAQG